MEKIRIPKWCNFSAEYSKNISDFFRAENIDFKSKEISLECLKHYYLKDKENGSLLIEEMSLRGFIFPNMGSRFLPNNFASKKFILSKNQKAKNYLNVNFVMANLGYLIKKFQVFCDGFFDYIPLEGFLSLRSDVELRILENEFNNNNFSLENITDTKDFQDISDNSNQAIEDEYPEITIREYLGKKALKFEFYCHRKGIHTIKELKTQGENFINMAPHINNELKKFISEKMKEVDENGIITDQNDFIYKVLNASPEQKNTEIRFLLPEKYENLSRRIKGNGIEKVRDLYKCLEDIPGIGNSKIKMIKEIVIKYLNGELKARPNLKELNGLNSYKIPETILNFNISDFFCSMGVDNFLDVCESSGLVHLSDFMEWNLNDFFDKVSWLGKEKRDKILEKLLSDRYNCEPKELVNLLFLEAKNNCDFELLFDRIENEKTLQELADEKGLTRERIRQMEAKSMRIIHSTMNMSIPLIISLLNNPKVITVEDINRIYNDKDDAKVVYRTIKNRTDLFYKFDNCTNLYILNKCKKIYICVERIKGLFESAFIKLEDYIDDINEILTSYELDDVINEEEIREILRMADYKPIGKVFVKKSTSMNKVYNSLFKTFFPRGLRLDEDGCKKIREIYEKYIGVPEYRVDNDRNLTMKLTRLEDNIICGNATYINIDNVHVDRQLIHRIKTYITQLFEEEKQTSITASKVFEVFESVLRANDVDNYMYLYGIIRYYYPDDFIYDNFWFCYKDNSKDNYSRFDSFIDYLKKYNTPNKGVSKEELKENFAISDVIIYNLSVLDDVAEVYFKKNLIYKPYLQLSKPLLEKIRDFITNNMREYYGIISIKTLLNKYDIYLEQESIYDEDTLCKVLSKYLTNYHFKDGFITDVLIEENLDTEYFYNLFINNNKIITRAGLEEFGDKYSLIKNRVYAIMNQKFPELYQINYTDFVKSINIDQDCINQINEMLDRKMKEKEFCLLSDFARNGEIFLLPDVGYNWNEYLLRSVLEKNNLSERYTLIKIPGTILFVERGLIVEKSINIDNYHDFLIYKYYKYDSNVENLNKLRERWLAEGVINGDVPTAVRNEIVDEFGRMKR